MTHGALSPDSARPATDLGPDAPLSILGDWTRALLEQEGRGIGRSGHGPGAAAGGRAAGPGKAAREDQRRIVELTEQANRTMRGPVIAPACARWTPTGPGGAPVALVQGQGVHDVSLTKGHLGAMLSP